MKTEAEFEKEIQFVAQSLGCRYAKIPDTKMINKYNRSQNREEKRPCDGILITPKGNILVECKVNHNKLLTHQERFRDAVCKINGQFVILRKKFYKNKVDYMAETLNHSVQYNNMRDILKFVIENA